MCTCLQSVLMCKLCARGQSDTSVAPQNDFKKIIRKTVTDCSVMVAITFTTSWTYVRMYVQTHTYVGIYLHEAVA